MLGLVALATPNSTSPIIKPSTLRPVVDLLPLAALALG